MKTKGNIFILPIRMQPRGCCCLQVRLKFQIILTTPNAPITVHYPKFQMPNKSNKLKKDR